MAASQKTVDDLIKVIMTYVPLYRHESLLKELKAIDGNKSFKDTVKLIEKRIKALAV